MKQVVLPEKINKITLDFNKREFFVDGIFIGKGVYFFDICFDNGDWKISVNNNIKEYVNPPKKGLTEKGACKNMYRKKLIEQLKFFEEKQRHCDILENAVEISKVICDLAKKIEEVDKSSRTVTVKVKVDETELHKIFSKEMKEFGKRMRQKRK